MQSIRWLEAAIQAWQDTRPRSAELGTIAVPAALRLFFRLYNEDPERSLRLFVESLDPRGSWSHLSAQLSLHGRSRDEAVVVMARRSDDRVEAMWVGKDWVVTAGSGGVEVDVAMSSDAYGAGLDGQPLRRMAAFDFLPDDLLISSTKPGDGRLLALCPGHLEALELGSQIVSGLQAR